MHQEYYIVTGKTRKGPYDLVAVVRKLRNGTLTGQTYLQQDESIAPRPAQEWEELAEFFNEIKEERGPTAEAGAVKRHGLANSLRSGVHFLQRNQYTTVYSGLFVLVIILLAAVISLTLPPAARIFGYAGCFILAHFMLSCYALSVLRMARGQPVDSAYLESKIVPALKSLLLSSIFVCIPCLLGLALLTSGMSSAVELVGLAIFTVPGLFALTLYAFTPLLIMDKGTDIWESMEMSRKAVMLKGTDNVGVIFAMFVMNFLAGLCILLPMSITLPITMGALTELYDERFA